MYRRSVLWGAFSALGIAFTTSRVKAATEASPPGKLKVVYHLADIDKVHFVLGNMQNHVDGVGGPENITLALVVHGPALRAFHNESANWDIAHRVGQFTKVGIELDACNNTMISQNITLKDLLPGFISAEKGGVVRLAELQSQGYLYLRP